VYGRTDAVIGETIPIVRRLRFLLTGDIVVVVGVAFLFLLREIGTLLSSMDGKTKDEPLPKGIASVSGVKNRENHPSLLLRICVVQLLSLCRSVALLSGCCYYKI